MHCFIKNTMIILCLINSQEHYWRPILDKKTQLWLFQRRTFSRQQKTKSIRLIRWMEEVAQTKASLFFQLLWSGDPFSRPLLLLGGGTFLRIGIKKPVFWSPVDFFVPPLNLRFVEKRGKKSMNVVEVFQESGIQFEQEEKIT